jgi:hypothetical protein
MLRFEEDDKNDNVDEHKEKDIAPNVIFSGK